MPMLRERLVRAATNIGLSTEDLETIFRAGELVRYGPGQWLFHESTPRRWFGLILDGDVEIVRGRYGRDVPLSTLGSGAFLSEGVLLDESAHAAGGFTRGGCRVWQIERPALERLREESPEVYYRAVGRVASRLGDRLRATSQRLADEAADARRDLGVRREADSLGERMLPASVYYGIQTRRAVENFPISGVRVAEFGHLVDALAMVKKAAALANHELGVLSEEKRDAICGACDEILEGRHHDAFVVDMIQGGAGTSTNMCANEVIANRGLELLGHARGDYAALHPNDDVNRSQSTNDAYPTAIKIAVVLSLRDLLGALEELRAALADKAREFSDVLKMGRTENQDAVPMTLGQEFGAYAMMVRSAMRSLEAAAEEMHKINMGATAIGTGLNSPPGYAGCVTRHLQGVSGLALYEAEDLVEATQDSGAFAQMSATLKRAAVQLSKICNDLRWLSSGPRCGLGEISLPAMQPGSSIMPGKVNPVIPEMVNQVCYQIVGYDMTISMAAEASELELNMAEPIMAFNLLHGIMILRNASVTLTSRCIVGIEANAERCREYVDHSIGLVTALNPVIGYERASAIAKEALATGESVSQLVLDHGWLTREQLEELLRPENMTNPRQVPR